jgi:hypothetical protein
MDTQELAMEQPGEGTKPPRVVEAEIKLPRIEDIKLPHVNLAPVRTIAEQVLLTGLGAGVLLARGLVYVVKAANAAGVEAAKQPGPIVKPLLDLVRPRESVVPGATSAEIRVSVPVLPLDNYDGRSADEILGQLEGLSSDQLRVLREYELGHQARGEVLSAIDRRLAV